MIENAPRSREGYLSWEAGEACFAQFVTIGLGKPVSLTLEPALKTAEMLGLPPEFAAVLVPAYVQGATMGLLTLGK